mmetsp:Transcript_47361/g.78396  ORF Transcript_47361/g.78396 Transcript_47361/m.78396 type:complete len:113 (-) Transcript_47361:317-655(-)
MGILGLTKICRTGAHASLLARVLYRKIHSFIHCWQEHNTCTVKGLVQSLCCNETCIIKAANDLFLSVVAHRLRGLAVFLTRLKGEDSACGVHYQYYKYGFCCFSRPMVVKRP